ncbi:hypothetical protein SESBI_29890 [Sesbania bispinosa]|nr:hypothetical protein SESBI_29890 [Sesbania bispinosa]
MSHEHDTTPIPMSDEKEQVPTPNMDESNVGEPMWMNQMWVNQMWVDPKTYL